MRNNDYKVELNFEYSVHGQRERKSYEDIKKDTLHHLAQYFNEHKKLKCLKVIRKYKWKYKWGGKKK